MSTTAGLTRSMSISNSQPHQHFFDIQPERRHSLSQQEHYQTTVPVEQSSMIHHNVARLPPSSSQEQKPMSMEGGKVHASQQTSNGGWTEYQYHGMERMPSSHQIPSTNQQMSDANENAVYGFARHDGMQAMGYENQKNTWQIDENAGSCTPMAGYDNMHAQSSTQHHGLGFVSTEHESAHQTIVSPIQSQFDATNNNMYGQSSAPLMSPDSTKDWASMSPGTDQMNNDWPLEITSHGHTPLFVTSQEVIRRDGIRKKNARFEIPAERNLHTIDKLISTSTDEQTIKELKQQKRLLRNRQAALDSRQRKKQHTERLEEEKKQYTSVITELEEMTHTVQREKENWAVTCQNQQQMIMSLQMEKEELIRQHTNETAELRRKNHYLSEQVQRLEGVALSAAPSSTGFSTEFSDFDHMGMHSSPWEHFPSVHDFSLETDPPIELPTHTQMPTSASTTSIHTTKPSSSSNLVIKQEDEPPATSGLFLLLLLCGAWVASKGPLAALPRMPDDVRAASASVLDHLYQDAGVDGSQQHQTSQMHHQKLVVLSRSKVQPVERYDNKGTLSHTGETPLESLHRHLTSPSDDQNRSQVFGLSASQFRSISGSNEHSPGASHGMYTYDEPNQGRSDELSSVMSPRKKIQESLADWQGKHPVGFSASEGYTRSLLWDRLDADIVKDFARLMAETGSAGNAAGSL
ncbi:hypothetical protein MMC25_005051 [Agyrium rufum]|nr:hypothetical protein [Agyrium rufum]